MSLLFFFFDKKMKIYVSVLSRSCFSLKHNDLWDSDLLHPVFLMSVIPGENFTEAHKGGQSGGWIFMKS